jgi:hypothetical protein
VIFSKAAIAGQIGKDEQQFTTLQRIPHRRWQNFPGCAQQIRITRVAFCEWIRSKECVFLASNSAAHLKPSTNLIPV